MSEKNSKTSGEIHGFKEILKKTGLPPLIIVVLCLGIWGLFYPANMSPDSFDQLSQAITQKYNDWHPPLMAITVSFFLRFGGTLGAFMLLQCMFGGLGVYLMAKSFIETACIKVRNPSYSALLVFSILLLPVSPLPCYLMTFWKDAWCMILFCWILATAMILFRKAEVLTSSKFYALYVLLVSFSVLAMLIRHNAVVIMPSIMCIAWMILHHKRKIPLPKSLLLGAIPLLLYIAFQQGQYHVFSIEKRHPEKQIMALDLVGMIIEEPSLRKELPYTNQHLTKEYKTAYRFGAVNRLLWRDPCALEETFTYGPAVIQEYKRAITKFPLVWMRVKLKAFYELIKPYRTTYWYHIGMVRNGFGMEQNKTFEPIRSFYNKILNGVKRRHPLRLISGVHIVWIAINLIWIVYYIKHKIRKNLFLIILLSVPFTYYLSYIPATTAWDFRFMYPATLCIQIITMACLVGRLFQRFCRE
jgi:hypothetical protein